MKNTTIKNIDSYIESAPKEARAKLKKIRQTIKKVAPSSMEVMSYGMPAFKYNNKYLAYFAIFKNHIGFYPIPPSVEKFKKELSEYKTGRGSVQFPLDRPVPYDLIKKMVSFRKKNIGKK